jgi:hydrogenase small subunit
MLWNIQAAYPNPTGAKGLVDFLREDAGIPNPTVINISRCPGNAEDMLAALTFILVNNKIPELDGIGRPKFLYGQLTHDSRERRAHFDTGEFVTL